MFQRKPLLNVFFRMIFVICPGRCLVPRDSVGSKFLPQWSTYRWSLGFLSRETLLIGFLSWETLRIGFFYAFVWQGGQWWTRYQPVSYKLESRFSKSNQFKHSLFYHPARHFDLMHKKNLEERKSIRFSFQNNSYLYVATSTIVDCPTQLICTWIFICCVPWQS